MRILYITPTDVTDWRVGAAQRGSYLGRVLSGMGDVTVEVAHELEPKGSVRWFLRRTVSALLPGMMFPLSRPVLGHYDAVVVRYVRYAAYYGAWRFGKLYIDADDLPEDVAPRWARGLFRVWTRWVVRKAEAVWLANPADVGRTGSGRDLPLENIPIPPKPGFRFDCERKPRVITVANLKYRPNLEGIGRFLRREWPRMHAERPELEYRIIGAGLSPRLQRKWGTVPGVKVMGFVKDVDAEYEVCEAVVCPIVSGSGTNIKVMEAMVRKRRLIATEFAMRGIGEIGTEERFRDQVVSGLSEKDGKGRVS